MAADVTLPFALAYTDERPAVEVPAVERWSENYAFTGYDYGTRIGYAAYVGRWVKDPTVWREQLYLYLPDGTVLQHQGLGPASDPDVPSGGAVRFRCDEPGGRWRIDFRGGMRHERVPDLIGEPLAQAEPHPVEFAVEIDHPYPVWMMPTEDNSTYGKYHYEQMGTCRGRFRFTGRDHEFTGPGYRDHSRGPRHLGAFAGHFWIQVHVPAGPQFVSYQAWARVGDDITRVLDQSVAVEPDGFGPATLHGAQRLSALETLSDPIELDITTGGERRTLRCTPIATQVCSLTSDFDFFYGYPRLQAEIVAPSNPC